MADYDVLIRGGTVVDGTGAPPEVLDVGVDGGRIAAVGRLDSARAGKVVEAAGLAVAPGFIDVHVHSEFARLGGRDQFAAVLDGVTTELMSPDGFGWAPLPRERLREVEEYLRVFYGRPDVSWDWASASEYLSIFTGRIPNNLVPQAPHLAIRVAAMGWEPGRPTEAQLRFMKQALIDWLELGAVGLAAGLEYQPGALSPVDELIELCRLVAEAGGVYAPHQRGYWARLAQGCRESFEVGRNSGVKVHISHLAVDDAAARLLSEGESAGVDLSFDMYPYSAACTHLLMMLPEWAQAGGHEPALRRLKRPDAGLRADTAARLSERGDITLSSVEGSEELEGRRLGELAQSTGRTEVDELFDLLQGHRGRALAIYHWPESIDADGIIRRTLAHPLYIGSTDGIYMGTRPHRRGFGTFARIVGEHVRDGTLTLEEAVRKVSGLPAERFGLRDRGVLHAGNAADVTVFDPTKLADVSTWENGRAAPTGIEHVLVNGTAVVAGGRPTGALPGKVVGR